MSHHRSAPRRLAFAIHIAVHAFAPFAFVLATEPATAAEQAVRSYSIPAGPLSSALSRFAGEAGILLSAEAKLTDGKSSPGLQGRHTLQQGLAAILAGSGLEAIPQGDGYSLRRVPVNSAVLPKVRISADAAETATGPVAGYAAKRTVTGTRTDTPIRDVPQTINIVTRDELRDRGVVKITEVFKTVPGVLPGTGYGGLANGYGTFVRGFETSTDYRDGFRDFASVSARDVALFERIEILKGPSSVLYGSNDPGGVINYVSKRPLFESAHEVSVSAGSYNARRIETDLSDPLGESGNASYRLVTIYDERDSHRDYVSSDTRIVAPSLAWKIGEATLVTLLTEFLHYDFTFERGLMTVPEMIDLPRDRFLEEPGLNYAKIDSKRFVLEMDHDLNTAWSLRTALSYLKPTAEKLNFYPMGMLDERTLDRSMDYSEEFQRDQAAQVELTGRFATGAIDHVVLTGFEYFRSDFHYTFAPFDLSAPIDIHDPQYGQVTIPPGFLEIVAFGNEYGSRTTAVYVQDQLTLSPQWKAMIGVRYNRARLFNDDLADPTASMDRQTQSKTSPRAGLVYEPTKATALFAGYSSSFNPQIFDVDLNGDLPKPQEGKQLEIGWRESWRDDVLQSTVSVFEIRKQNVTTDDPNSDDPNVNIQVGEQRSRGVEVELRGQMTTGLDVIFAGTWLDTEISRDHTLQEGDAFAGAPDFYSSLWLKYQPQARGWFGGGGVFHIGEREANLPNDGVEFPTETRVDALLGYEAGAWRAQMNLRNITDEELYVPYSGLFIPGPGPNGDLTVTFNF